MAWFLRGLEKTAGEVTDAELMAIAHGSKDQEGEAVAAGYFESDPKGEEQAA